ncbi:hypothetical protein NLM24_43085 [Nocardia zapadnayensis]|nr:hypothetical protein [Nocardia zapadnayensis]MCX0277272.1 hypothetical protein [Nocardia zapadnayensis]
MQDVQLLPNLLSGAGGAALGVAGTLIGVQLQNRAADKRQRADIALRFYSRADRLGVQAMRAARRADELDPPMEPGWDLQLIEMIREIELRYSAGAARDAENVVESLTEIVETGTVGSIMRFDGALSKFAKASRIQKRARASKRVGDS